jgi:hypothetical protein
VGWREGRLGTPKFLKIQKTKVENSGTTVKMIDSALKIPIDSRRTRCAAGVQSQKVCVTIGEAGRNLVLIYPQIIVCLEVDHQGS